MNCRKNESERLEQATALIDAAIRNGMWIDPGPVELRRMLGHDVEDLPDLELFKSRGIMRGVAFAVERNFLPNPLFCMVRTRNEVGPSDPRLALSGALFVAGAKAPGEDVVAAVDVNAGAEELRIRIFDWNRRVPNRWVHVTSLESFIAELSRLVRTKTVK